MQKRRWEKVREGKGRLEEQSSRQMREWTCSEGERRFEKVGEGLLEGIRRH